MNDDELYIDEDNGMIGLPEIQEDFYIHQAFDDNCAVAAETNILNQCGIDISQEDAAFISSANGWYHPGSGTSPDDIGNLLEMNGIGTHQVTDASIQDLASELAQGHGVIIGVRSNDLWEQGGALDQFWEWICDVFGFDNSTFMPADHAITVTGIDVSDPDHPMVLVNDSGVPDGAANAYPLDKFMDAWENSGFYYTATDDPLPALANAEDNGIDWGHWLGEAGNLFLDVGVDLISNAAGTAVAEFSGNLELGHEAYDLVSDFSNDLLDATFFRDL